MVLTQQIINQKPNDENESIKDCEVKKGLKKEMVVGSESETGTNEKIFDIGAGILVGTIVVT